jgi:hypothetical protein
VSSNPTSKRHGRSVDQWNLGVEKQRYNSSSEL